MTETFIDAPAETPENPQPSLKESALELLEFPQVRQMLAGQTRFFRSRELAHQVAAQSHYEDVVRLQEETAEASLMLSTVGDIGLTGHEDLRPAIRRAALGGMLAGQELISIVILLESTWLARNSPVTSTWPTDRAKPGRRISHGNRQPGRQG